MSVLWLICVVAWAGGVAARPQIDAPGPHAAHPLADNLDASIVGPAAGGGHLTEITRLINSLLVLQSCFRKDVTNCYEKAAKCLFKYQVSNTKFGPPLNAGRVCGGDEVCAREVQECVSLVAPLPDIHNDIPEEICRNKNIVGCEGQAVQCLAEVGVVAPDTTPPPPPAGFDSSVCIEIMQPNEGVATAVSNALKSSPTGSSTTTTTESTTTDSTTTESTTTESTTTPDSDFSSVSSPGEGSPLGLVAGIINNVLVLQMCIDRDEPDCLPTAARCMFEYGFAPKNFGFAKEVDEVCEGNEACLAASDRCLSLLKAMPGSDKKIPKAICRGSDVSGCEGKAGLCLASIGLGPGSPLLIQDGTTPFPPTPPTQPDEEPQDMAECLKILTPNPEFPYTGVSEPSPTSTSFTSTPSSSAVTEESLTEQLIGLSHALQAKQHCAGKDIPNCVSRSKNCYKLFTDNNFGPDGSEPSQICGVGVNPSCLRDILECNELLTPTEGPPSVSEMCADNSNVLCSFEGARCMRAIGMIFTKSDPCEVFDKTACDADLAKCIALLQPIVE